MAVPHYVNRMGALSPTARMWVELSCESPYRSATPHGHNARNMALQAGTRLGPYDVVSLIGVGGMGEVWLASELRLGRKVALKLLPLLIVDYGANGRPVGVEITAPPAVPLELLNQLLADLGEARVAEQEYKPLRAA